MAISWRRAAAVLLCAMCAAAAAPGLAGLTMVPAGLDMPPAAGRMVTPSIEPASVVTTAEPPTILQLRLPDLSLPSEEAVQDFAVRTGLRLESAATQTHTVAAGDTLWDIAKAAGVRVEALAAANDLSKTGVLRVGRVLAIPPAGTYQPAPAAAVTTRASSPRSRLALRAEREARISASTVPAADSAAVDAAAGGGTGAPVAMLWPSRGIVTSRFGWRIHPIFGGPEFHTGMDIATRYGSPVVAARAGVVRFVGWKTGYGRMIVVEHDGALETAYSHLSEALVGPGEHVTQGQTIGRIGNTGWSTGPHLLFEVRRNGVPVDPAPYLN
jgi:murein DD-endopeptidase MepM/ murein hydrolase activator NlpD